MKYFIQKAISLIFLFSLFTKDSKAQGVNFEDPFFQQWVKTHYPSCVFADESIDVTCSAIVNEDTLDFSGPDGSGITSFNGLQYFTSLRYLDISNNTNDDEQLWVDAYDLPLVSTLKVLKCRDIQGTGGTDVSMLSLPAGLEYLDISQNNATALTRSTSLPALPSSLNTLIFRATTFRVHWWFLLCWIRSFAVTMGDT